MKIRIELTGSKEDVHKVIDHLSGVLKFSSLKFIYESYGYNIKTKIWWIEFSKKELTFSKRRGSDMSKNIRDQVVWERLEEIIFKGVKKLNNKKNFYSFRDIIVDLKLDHSWLPSTPEPKKSQLRELQLSRGSKTREQIAIEIMNQPSQHKEDSQWVGFCVLWILGILFCAVIGIILIFKD